MRTALVRVSSSARCERRSLRYRTRVQNPFRVGDRVERYYIIDDTPRKLCRGTVKEGRGHDVQYDDEPVGTLTEEDYWHDIDLV